MSTPRPHLHVATMNIHKGFSAWNRRMTVHSLRDALRALDADIVFLQEVQGHHGKHRDKYENWPELPQHEFLAEEIWTSAYGKNAVYDHGHHGNAILSRFPIVSSVNYDVSDFDLEQRGMLHCQIDVPGQTEPVHCVCVHLSLLGRSRQRQMEKLVAVLEPWRMSGAPFLIAGDFNDWRNRAKSLLAEKLGLTEVFSASGGQPAVTFPVYAPKLRLDRIYVRGFEVVTSAVHRAPPWSDISDHAALSADLICEPRALST